MIDFVLYVILIDMDFLTVCVIFLSKFYLFGFGSAVYLAIREHSYNKNKKIKKIKHVNNNKPLLKSGSGPHLM